MTQPIVYELSLSNSGWYVLQMGIGTPPIPVRLGLDTMSDYLVVQGELCRKCHVKVYKPGYSSTEHNTGRMWDLNYDLN